MKKYFLVVFMFFTMHHLYAQYTPIHKVKADTTTASFRYNFIPSNLVVTNWGIICKKEWQVEKSIKIPFKFRLGSIAYCNTLEGYKY